MEYNHEQSMKKRMKVLSYALTLELLTSLTLGYILDINDVENSRSLGKMNSSLSFAQKMNLLLDNETITSGEKSKLDAFMNMRNQFMHNKSAYSYFHAFNSTNGDLNRFHWFLVISIMTGYIFGIIFIDYYLGYLFFK